MVFGAPNMRGIIKTLFWKVYGKGDASNRSNEMKVFGEPSGFDPEDTWRRDYGGGAIVHAAAPPRAKMT